MWLFITCIVWCLPAFVYSAQLVEPKDKAMNLLAFHTGLKGNVPYYSERRLPLMDAVLESDADVLCLSEIWYVKDMIEMRTTLEQKYPHSFSFVHNDDNILLDDAALAIPPCAPTAVAFGTAVACFQTKCTQQNKFETYVCFLTTCKGLELLSAECTACVLVSGANLLQCVQPAGSINAFAGPGLAIFSKHPLTDRETRDLLPGKRRILPRWILTAKVEGLGYIGCTHFSTLYPGTYVDPEYPRLFSSYQEQNRNNTMEVLKMIKRKRNFILMGDTNQSPRRCDLVPNMPDNYQKILYSGFENPYVDSDGPATLGKNNPLSYFRNSLYIFDHIFQRGFTASNPKRVFDEFLIEVDNTTIPISDHYGVSVTFQRKEKMYHKKRRVY